MSSTRQSLPVLVNSMQGLGDSIYQRALIRHLQGDVFVSTPWPELFSDLEVRCVRPVSKLRTQLKNAAQSAYAWAPTPLRAVPLFPSYSAQALARTSVIECLANTLGVKQAPVFDLPPLPPSVITCRQPIALVRPVTVRREWAAPARNPLPEYVAQASALLRQAGFFVVSVADLDPGVEDALAPLPEADLYVHHGELRSMEVLSLLQASSAVVGGVGWIVPAAIAAKVPACIVLGGNGAHNAPQRVLGPMVDAPWLHFIKPEHFCECADRRHACDKNINSFEQECSSWIQMIQQAV